MPGTYRSQKRAVNPPELELQMDVSGHVDGRNQPQVLYKNNTMLLTIEPNKSLLLLLLLHYHHYHHHHPYYYH